MNTKLQFISLVDLNPVDVGLFQTNSKFATKSNYNSPSNVERKDIAYSLMGLAKNTKSDVTKFASPGILFFEETALVKYSFRGDIPAHAFKNLINTDLSFPTKIINSSINTTNFLLMIIAKRKLFQL